MKALLPLSVFFMLLMPACIGDRVAEPDTSPRAAFLDASPSVERLKVPSEAVSRKGRSIRCRQFGSGDDTVLIIGGIHGDEPASATLADELCRRLGRSEEVPPDRRVVVIPVANPDGLANNRRTNARSVDINRNFRTSNRRAGEHHGSGPSPEPETKFIAEVIAKYEPVVVVQIHQPLACVDWDGPAGVLAREMSRACGLPARKLGARPGSLGSYAGVDLHIPTITLELPGAATRLSSDKLWRKYGPALRVAIAFNPETHDSIRVR